MERPAPLIGHTAAQTSLNTLRTSGKFPHAILLHGPAGIGKRKLAELTAQTLICGAEEEANLARMSPNFLSSLYAQIMVGSNADYHILTPEKGKKSISIDQTRHLLSGISLSTDTPRTIIIDAAEHLTPEAANALLKTLEEPQPNTHFFLVCHAISKLLPTIISRCRPIRLTPLSAAETLHVLQTALPDAENLAQLAQSAAGCPGVAIANQSNHNTEIENLLTTYLQNPHNPITTTEKIAQRKQIPAALNILQRLLHQTPQNATEYATLATDLHSLDTYNLTPAWVLEKTLRNLNKSF